MAPPTGRYIEPLTGFLAQIRGVNSGKGMLKMKKNTIVLTSATQTKKKKRNLLQGKALTG